MRHLTLIILLLTGLLLTASQRRIAVLSDIHVTEGNANDSALRVAVAEINATPGIDYVIVNGDLTNEGSNSELRHVKGTLDLLQPRTYVLPGNHEDTWSQSATKTFTDLWGADRFLDVTDDMVMIGINCGPYMKMGDGHIKQEDLHWLDSALTANAGHRVLSFCHYPPRKDDLDNYLDYLAVLERHPVVAHINGHYHSWMTYPAGNLPGIGVRALWMPKTKDYGYAILDITADSLKVFNKPLGQQPQLYKSFGIRAPKAPNAPNALKALNAPQGCHLVWADSASAFTRLAFDDNNVYFGTSTGHARAVDKAAGTLRWSHPTGAPLFSRPVAVGHGLIAFPTAKGITALQAGDGAVFGTRPSREGPYVADGVVQGTDYIQGGYKRIECYDITDGSRRWTYDSIFNYCQGAPAVDGRDVIFGAWDTNLRCLDRSTGHLRWVWNNGRKNNMLGPGNVVPVVTAHRVYIVAPDRYMTCLDRATGRQLWRDNSHKYRESLGHSADRTRVYAKTMDGELVAVDATAPDFKELWTLDMGLGYEHAPCIVAERDGLVYAGSRRGIVTVIDPSVPRVVASLVLGSSEVNGIDIDPSSPGVWASLIEGTIWHINPQEFN